MISRDILDDARSGSSTSKENDLEVVASYHRKRGHIPLLLKVSTLLLGAMIARSAFPSGPDNDQGNNHSPNKISTSAPPHTSTAERFRMTHLPPQPNYESALFATATALSKENKQSSFSPEQGFSQEVFEQVQQGTFLIEIVGEVIDGPEKGQVKTADGTGWLAKKDDGTYYFVSNRHLFEIKNIKMKSVEFWRPGIDEVKARFEWDECTTALSSKMDVGIIKCEDPNGKFEHFDQEAIPLNYTDNAEVERGEPLLMVGFPHNFFISDQKKFDSRTLGSVISKEKDYYYADQTGWWAQGLNSGGGSGSPVAILDQGKPIIVGMMYASGQAEVHIDDHTTQAQNVLIITPLDMNELMAEVDR